MWFGDGNSEGTFLELYEKSHTAPHMVVHFFSDLNHYQNSQRANEV